MPERMMPRQRVLAALRHEVPDVIPAQVFNVLEWEKRTRYFGVRTFEELADKLGNTIAIHTPPFLHADAGDLWRADRHLRPGR